MGVAGVTAALRDAGHEVHPLTLTGVGERSHLLGPHVDLDTHTEDIVRLAEAADLHDIVLVGHSYGGLPVSAAALRLRDRIQAGGLCRQRADAGRHGADGHVGRRATTSGDAMAPREWDPAEGPAAAGRTGRAALEQLRTRSTPHPVASVRQRSTARATSEDLPTVLIACTFPTTRSQAMKAAGHPFFAGLGDARIIRCRPATGRC